MIFAIDFDGTFASDPKVFRAITAMLKANGHTVVCVTGRSDEGEFGDEVRRCIDGCMPVVFAGAQWKRKAAHAAGYKVDVWIDDNPEYVDEQHIIRAQHKLGPW